MNDQHELLSLVEIKLVNEVRNAQFNYLIKEAMEFIKHFIYNLRLT